MEKISFAAGHEYTLASVQRDFVEWRKERTHYAVWAIDVDTPALRAATAAMRAHLADKLLNGYRRQPHVTLHLCGFPSTSPSFDDDYPGTELQRQIAALQAAGYEISVTDEDGDLIPWSEYEGAPDAAD